MLAKGPITSYRSHGRVVFISLQGVEPQLLIEGEALDSLRSHLALCQIGAIIEASGPATVTRKGQPAIAVQKMVLVRAAPNPTSLQRVAASHLPSDEAAGALAVATLPKDALDRQQAVAMARAMQGRGPRRVRVKEAKIALWERASVESVEKRLLHKWPITEPPGSVLDGTVVTVSVPSFSDSDRAHYAEHKKKPQVRWMVERVAWLLKGSKRKHVVDIGGGRGDLALAIAGSLGVRVTVIERNEPSLEAGKQRAEALGMKNVEFIAADANEPGVIPGDCGLLVGLHACGGLGEFVASLAVERRCRFLVCTCCAGHHSRLAVLSAKVWEGGDERDAIVRLAESHHPEMGPRAAAALNAVRLSGLEMMVRENGRVLEGGQWAFSAEMSERNVVMWGSVE